MVGVTIGSVLFNHGNSDLKSRGGSTSTSVDEFGVSVNPSYGWFINDQLALGISPGVIFNHKKIHDSLNLTYFFLDFFATFDSFVMISIEK